MYLSLFCIIERGYNNVMKKSPLFRSVLYLPASNARAIEKSRTINADTLIFDLEDSVAPNDRAAARLQLLEAFARDGFGDSRTVVRVNSIGSEDYLDDIRTVAECSPHGILLPKVSSATEVETFQRDSIIHGLKESIQSWFMIESSGGVIELPAIIKAGLRCRLSLQCLVVGHNDLAKDTGVSLIDNRCFLIPWLMQIILYAKHHRLEVLDSVWNDFKNLDGFRLEALQARAMGFSGKTLIHPTQVGIANEIFLPDQQEILQAKKIIAAFNLPENKDAAVINLDGEMIERLHLNQATDMLSGYDIDF